MALPQLQRTWDHDDVVTELRDALAVVDELAPPDDLRVAVFNYAAQLLSQRAQVQQLPIDLGTLAGLRAPGG